MPSLVRAQQVGGPVWGVAAHVQGAKAGVVQLLAQAGKVQRAVHGIAGLGVGQAELEHFAGRQAAADPAQGDACRGVCAQLVPGVGLGQLYLGLGQLHLGLGQLYPGLDHADLVASFSPLFRAKAPVLKDVTGFLRRALDRDDETLA